MQLNKSQLVSNINSEISDQAYGQITPYDIRHNLLDIIDSVSKLTLNDNLESLNFSTFSTGNTKVGISALDNIKINNATSNHNTAIGFEALRSNYQSSHNTAIGSNALSCNVYGVGNVAVGYSSLAGNTVGQLNVAIGNYTLNNSKSGTGNIAIGHGAGYYIDKNTHHKLFIGYHPVDNQHICDNPLGSGWMPLLYGDLSGIQLGIGTRSLNNYGLLHVGGNILPSGADTANLGHSLFPWSSLYLSRSIEFSNSASIVTSGSSLLRCSSSFYPNASNTYSLGSNSHVWLSGHFQDIKVNGVATINQINYVQTTLSSGKVFYLGVNANNNALYPDPDLAGGGLVLKSITSNKQYQILFAPPSDGMPGFSGPYNAVWQSNINLQVPNDRYIQSNSLIAHDDASFSSNDSFGLFFNSGITYLSRKNVLGANPGLSSSHIAGISNVNLIANSGSPQDYTLSLMALESGVSVGQKFLTGTKLRIKDALNNDADKLKGFELKYIDESSSNIIGPLMDRFVIGSYDDSSQFINALTVMKNNAEGGVVGINNMSCIAGNITPKTIFNVRSINDCVARFTAESNGYYKAAIQLLGLSNCEASGVELAYVNNSGMADIIMMKDHIKTSFIRLKDNQQVGLLSSGITNSTLTIGHSGIHQLPSISLKDDTFVGSSAIVASSGYGKIYNLRDNRFYADQYNSLIYLDSSGNKFNLVVNKLDNIDARAVYSDASGNTFAGYLAPANRKINDTIKNNTVYGYQALSGILAGSGNLVVGYNSLFTLSSGNDNIAIGSFAGSGLISSSNNIIIGNQAFNKSGILSLTSGNIVIGHNVGASQSGSHYFLLGNNPNVILLEGKLGPGNNDKRLTLPNNGKLYINNSDNTEGLGIKSNVIEVIDSGGTNYPDTDLRFRFIGSNSSDLMILNHNANPLTNAAVYQQDIVQTSPDTFVLVNTPYLELNGDLRLRGKIRFSDNTSLGSTSGITRATLLAQSGVNIANSGIDLINRLFVEGYMPTGMGAAPSNSTKTSGILNLKDNNWANSGNVFIINRDTTSVVHSGAYVIAARINNEYRPIWISADDTGCQCCDS